MVSGVISENFVNPLLVFDAKLPATSADQQPVATWTLFLGCMRGGTSANSSEVLSQPHP